MITIMFILMIPMLGKVQVQYGRNALATFGLQLVPENRLGIGVISSLIPMDCQCMPGHGPRVLDRLQYSRDVWVVFQLKTKMSYIEKTSGYTGLLFMGIRFQDKLPCWYSKGLQVFQIRGSLICGN